MGNDEKSNYTCTDYREEMRLLALTRKLEEPGLTSEERKGINEEIAALEKKMGMG